jgi:hypothetical protein
MIAATDTISESFRKSLSNKPGKHDIKEPEKSRTGQFPRTSDNIKAKVQNYYHGK